MGRYWAEKDVGEIFLTLLKSDAGQKVETGNSLGNEGIYDLSANMCSVLLRILNRLVHVWTMGLFSFSVCQGSRWQDSIGRKIYFEEIIMLPIAISLARGRTPLLFVFNVHSLFFFFSTALFKSRACDDGQGDFG